VKTYKLFVESNLQKEENNDILQYIQDYLDSIYDDRMKSQRCFVKLDPQESSCPECGSDIVISLGYDLDYDRHDYLCDDCAYVGPKSEFVSKKYNLIVIHTHNDNTTNGFSSFNVDADKFSDFYSTLNNLTPDEIKHLEHYLSPFRLKYYKIQTNSLISSFLMKPETMKEILDKLQHEEELQTKFL